MNRALRTSLVVLASLSLIAPWTSAQSIPADNRPVATRPAQADVPVSPQLRAQAGAAMQRGLKYLEAVQSPDGAWQAMGVPDPAITAIVAQAFAQDPHYGPESPIVRKALAFVLSHRQKDGGIYRPGLMLENYYTSVALMFLSTQPRGDRDVAKTIRDAQIWLKSNQWAESRERPDTGAAITPADAWYGGAGYGNSKRPDMSNTQMMLEALHQSGLPASDPTYQKALKFVTRCQMLSATNDQPYAAKASDGGFVYSPAGSGESKAGYTEVDGRQVLRSYGSMTYAGFKSMLYADLSHDDPRVKAAFDWIRRYYTLDENPNMPGAQSKQGLYYYYNVFGKALQAWGQDTIVDAEGKKHNWREDLIAKLAGLQRQDGAWLNEADRWYEGNPHYITGLAVLSMQSALLK
jgi:squalene-hopene/tetraprenyl-beta-curcumene cyclase